MSEKPSVDIKRFQPKKIHSKYWLKVILYALILGALIFWYKQKRNNNNNSNVNKSITQNQIDLKGVKIEE